MPTSSYLTCLRSLTSRPTRDLLHRPGFTHVLVNGTFVVRDDCLVIGARPGRSVRSEDESSLPAIDGQTRHSRDAWLKSSAQ